MLFKRILRNTKQSPILQEDISAHFSLVSRETQPSPSSTTLPQHSSGWRQRSGPSPPSHSSRTWAAPSVSSSGSPSCRSGTVLTLCWDIKMSEVKYIDCYYFNFKSTLILIYKVLIKLQLQLMVTFIYSQLSLWNYRFINSYKYKSMQSS